MTDARNNILAKLSSSNSKTRPKRLRLPEYKPTFQPEDKLDYFCQQLTANHIEVIRNKEHAWHQSLVEIAERKNLHHWLLGTGQDHQEDARLALNQSQSVTSITRFDVNFESLKESLFNNIDASLTIAQAGIVETGSLLVIPNSHEPRTMSLIPPVHVILLKTSQLVLTLDEAFEQNIESKTDLTNILVISSPSKTADIQQTLAYGAHGPKELVVILY